MKKLFTNLLLMLVMGVGSAWADTYTGTVSFEAKSRITNNNDGTFTTASNAGNGYSLAIADLSGLENISSASSVTVTFTATIPKSRLLLAVGDKNTRGTTANGSSKSTYNTDGLIMRVGTTDGTYCRINGGTNNSDAFSTSLKISVTLDRVNSKYSYTIVDAETGETTYFSGSNVSTSVSNATIVELYSWVGSTTFTISDVSYSYEYSASSFDYTVKAVDDDGNELKTIKSGTSTEAVSVYYPYAVEKDGVWYTTSTSSYVAEVTSIQKDVTVKYTANPNIKAYMDVESVVSDGEAAASRSNGYYGHVAGGKRANLGTFPAGKYKVTAYLVERGDRGIYVRNGNITQTADVDNTIVNCGTTKESAAGVYSTSEFTLTEETPLLLSGYTSGTSTNQSAGIDYILLEKTGDYTVTKTLGTTGYGTFSATCNVEVPTGVTVCTSTYADNTLTATSDASIKVIPANTGVIFKGTASTTYTFTATTTAGDAIETALTAAPTGVTGDGSTIFGLVKNKYEFAVVNSGVTLAANSAYLKIASGAKAVKFVVDDEATGINDVNANVDLNNAVRYNLAGQRVSANAKGIVIMNGKKYMNK